MVAGVVARSIQTAKTYGQKILGGTKSVGKSVGKGVGQGGWFGGASGVMGALTEPVDMGNQSFTCCWTNEAQKDEVLV